MKELEGDEAYNAIFIRAPAITRLGLGVRSLASVKAGRTTTLFSLSLFLTLLSSLYLFLTLLSSLSLLPALSLLSLSLSRTLLSLSHPLFFPAPTGEHRDESAGLDGEREVHVAGKAVYQMMLFPLLKQAASY